MHCESGGSIRFVFSDEPIDRVLCRELDYRCIEYYYTNYEKLGATIEEKRLRLSDRLLKKLEEKKIEYCISFGEHILTGDILKQYKNKIINFHPALLPMYKGINAIDQAVKDDNVMLVGNTAHFIDEGIDTGMIIMQSVIPLKAFFDSDNDYDIILDIQIKMLAQIIELLNTDRVKVINNKVLIEGADYSVAHIYPQI